MHLCNKLGENNELYKLRSGTKKKVETVIRRKYGNRYSVRFFGSVQYVKWIHSPMNVADYRRLSYGVSYPNSDLDMVVIVSPNTHPSGISSYIF